MKPGSVAGAAPHVNVNVFARGVLKQMFTRIYFEGGPLNERDPILNLVPADRRGTLIAKRDGTSDTLPRYVFDIRLQGDGETVFFAA